MRYYYADANRQATGPVERCQLQDLLKTGVITPDSLIIQEGGTQWRAYKEWTEADFGGEPTPGGQATAPASIRVLGILNLIFGGMAVLCTPVAIVMILLMNRFNPAETGVMGTPYGMAYTIISTGLGMVAAVVEIISGIGLLRKRKWGRTLALGYGGYGILAGLAGIVVALTFAMPSTPANLSVFTRATGIMSGVFGMIYPVLLIVFLCRQKVVAALT